MLNDTWSELTVLNKLKIMQKNMLKLSKKAQNFYENTRSKTLVSGYERNILVREDAENCLFVKSDYDRQKDDVIFRCQTINQNTIIELR